MTGVLNWTIAATDVGDPGLSVTRAASRDECARLAADLRLLSCDRLDARLRVKPLGGGRFRLTGELDAAVTQSCVVSLDPVPGKVREEFDVEFQPEADGEDGSVEHEALAVPEIEPIENGLLDIGRIVYETLAAGLDPYPRKPGAKLEWRDPLQASESGPFAALRKIRDGA